METQGERTKMLRVRLTPAELHWLQSQAQEEKRTVSEMVRRRLLGIGAAPIDAPSHPTDGTIESWLAYAEWHVTHAEGLLATVRDQECRVQDTLDKWRQTRREIEQTLESPQEAKGGEHDE